MRNLNLADEGDYSCQNLNPSEKESVTLFVTTAPTIYNITAIQTATAGQYVALACKASGSPTPDIRWRHTRPNNRLPNGIEGEFKKGIHFNITAITLEDRGEYECIASNGVPKAKSEQKKTTFIRMNYEPVVTALTDENPEVKIPDGDSASLTCKSMAFPRPSTNDVLWYLDEVLINDVDGYQVDVVHQLPSEKVDPYDETTYTTLNINVVNSNRTGEYKCQFSNERGSSAATISLQNGSGKDRASVLSLSLVTILSMILFSLVH
ncbi:limbic system-associated membrane protein-like isoform X2 [Amphiura filiformis]|uniref:limbic system-associated membrane protein-like isoform X2 n=1 Tax=Amphiura filiformis TaxID=82378 RepID=UPI003B20C33B